mmetsp:Transcript_21742/g.55425  ORF Transcript_21742/g.55425 Transcript_21742/m.55425 type:complete len:220 (-) Transcript_21742:799-1458(-)
MAQSSLEGPASSPFASSSPSPSSLPLPSSSSPPPLTNRASLNWSPQLEWPTLAFSQLLTSVFISLSTRSLATCSPTMQQVRMAWSGPPSASASNFGSWSLFTACNTARTTPLRQIGTQSALCAVPSGPASTSARKRSSSRATSTLTVCLRAQAAATRPPPARSAASVPAGTGQVIVCTSSPIRNEETKVFVAASTTHSRACAHPSSCAISVEKLSKASK